MRGIHFTGTGNFGNPKICLYTLLKATLNLLLGRPYLNPVSISICN